MQVADPSGPGTAGVIRYECTGGMVPASVSIPTRVRARTRSETASDAPSLGLPLTGTPTPGFEPRSRSRQDRMIAELHHVGMHGSRLGSIDHPSSESNGPYSSPAGIPGLHAATATRAGDGRTSGSQYAQRVRGRTFTFLSGANGNQNAASLTQLARSRPRHGTLGVSAGGRPVFPGPERVVRVGARLYGQ
jgi:hypothetical protein